MQALIRWFESFCTSPSAHPAPDLMPDVGGKGLLPPLLNQPDFAAKNTTGHPENGNCGPHVGMSVTNTGIALHM